MGSKDKRWYLWVPALSTLLVVPGMLIVLLSSNTYLALVCMFVPGFLQNLYLGNSIATTHNLVGLRWRSTSSAILFLILNIIGLGMGPFMIGLLSDFFDPSLGVESLRYAMLAVLPTACVWSSIHFYLASLSLNADLKRAPD